MDQGIACDEDPSDVAALGYPGSYDPRKYSESFAFKDGVLRVRTSTAATDTVAHREIAGMTGFHYGSAYAWSALMPGHQRASIKKISEVEIVLSNGRVGVRRDAGDCRSVRTSTRRGPRATGIGSTPARSARSPSTGPWSR